jgi:alkylhydroperoxidase/carboxymuconolactone decarboxylase family protein YurZ
MSLSKDSAQLKQNLISNIGEAQWDETWDSIAKLSPELFEASVNLIAVPRKKRHLSPKIQELMSIAVDAASTHLYIPGIQKHIKAALKEGATQAEIVEVIELTGTLGIHACNIGVPLLVEVMKEEGIYEQHPTAGKPFDAQREKLKADFTKNRGYWHTFWEDFLALDPEFFEAYLNFSSVPWLKDVDGSGKGGGVLEPKVISPSRSVVCSCKLTAYTGQRTNLLRIRCGSHTSLRAWSQTTYEECSQLWWNSRGDHGSFGNCNTTEPAYIECGSSDTSSTTRPGIK